MKSIHKILIHLESHELLSNCPNRIIIGSDFWCLQVKDYLKMILKMRQTFPKVYHLNLNFFSRKY